MTPAASEVCKFDCFKHGTLLHFGRRNDVFQKPNGILACVGLAIDENGASGLMVKQGILEELFRPKFGRENCTSGRFVTWLMIISEYSFYGDYK